MLQYTSVINCIFNTRNYYGNKNYVSVEVEQQHNKNKEREVSIMKKLVTDKAPAAIGPYSQAIEINGMVFTSGQIPVNPATGEIAATVEEQAEQALKNVAAVLAAAGTGMENVIKTTVFIKEMNDFGKINEIYAKFFTGAYPARSCVEVARLPKDVLIEVEAIATK